MDIEEDDGLRLELDRDRLLINLKSGNCCVAQLTIGDLRSVYGSIACGTFIHEALSEEAQ